MSLIIATSFQINDRQKTERVKIIHRQFRNMALEICHLIEDIKTQIINYIIFFLYQNGHFSLGLFRHEVKYKFSEEEKMMK